MDPEIWDALPKAVEWIFPLTSVISRARINCELDMQMKQVAIKVAWRPVGRSDAKGMKAFDLEGWEEDFEYHTLQKKGGGNQDQLIVLHLHDVWISQNCILKETLA